MQTSELIDAVEAVGFDARIPNGGSFSPPPGRGMEMIDLQSPAAAPPPPPSTKGAAQPQTSYVYEPDFVLNVEGMMW